MNIKYTSGLALLLVGILGTPLAVLLYRELNSVTPQPTPQIRLLDSPLARITTSVPQTQPFLPLTSNSISGKPGKPTPEPSTIDWGDVTNKPAGFADNLDNDALAELTCEVLQLARWNGSAWECFFQGPPTTRIISQSFTFVANDASTKAVTANCDTDEWVTGGGTSQSSAFVTVRLGRLDSLPVSIGTGLANGWKATAFNSSNRDIVLTVFAVCMATWSEGDGNRLTSTSR